MATMKILSEKPVTMAELKNEIESIKKRDKELNFRANKTEEYLNQFVTAKKSEGIIDLSKKLAALDIPRLKEQHINKIVDIMPTTIKDLKVVLQNYILTVNNENMKRIVETINEFTAKK